MKQLRLLGLFIFLVICHFKVNAQIGNYIARDSTITPALKNYNFIHGTKAAINLENPGSTALRNTIIGSYAAFSIMDIPSGYFNSNPSDNTIIGAFAGYKRSGINGSGNIFANTYLGAFAGYSVQKGNQNTLLGYNVASQADNLYTSVMIGNEAGKNSTYSSGNVFVGFNSGYNNASFTNYNTYIGFYSGSGFDDLQLKGSENVYIGAFAGQRSNTSNTNTSFAGRNTFVGTNSGLINNNDNNTFIGHNSGSTNGEGNRNTFLGNNSGLSNTSGSGNTFLGVDAGRNNRSGFDNVFIGYNAGINLADSANINHSVALGPQARVTASNSLILGDFPMKVGIGNTAPQNKLEITSATTNTSGLRFTNLKSTSTPSTANSLALSVDANGDVILVPAATGGLTNPVTNLQVLSGTAGVSGLRLNNLPLSTTATAANDKTLSVDATGNVILVTAPAGFTNPLTNLQVQSGTAGVSGLTLNNVNSASATTTANGKVLSVDATGNVILVPATATVLPAGADVWDQLVNGADYLIRNKNNKSVMIGTVAAAKTSIDYKLYVEKGILAEKVKVSAQANWPDYVFGKDYSLMPLKEVENYISTNNHLPEVPSAEVIAKDGLDLGKMDATLLKKVEELTLYLIEQNKKIEVLQNKLNTLKAKK